MTGDLIRETICSIIIRAYNEGAHIGRLLTGISQQTIKNHEIIVVDSGSTDDTIAIAERLGAKIVTISPEEFTFGRSLNMGVSEGRGEYIINVSAHCYPVYPDWLERLLEPFEDETIAISYGKQRGGETNHYSENQIFKKYFPDISQPNQGNPYSHNANAAVRRELWEQNPYNENITGLEDLAWSSWVMDQNYGIAYVAEAEVIHLHDEKPSEVLNRHYREAVALKQILPNSQFSFWNFLRLWLTSTGSDIVAARREKVLGKEWRGIVWFRFLQYLGTYRGYHYSGKVDAELHRTFYYPPNILDGKQPAKRAVQPIDYDQNKVERNNIL